MTANRARNALAPLLGAATMAIAGLGFGGVAAAQTPPACSSLPNPVYLTLGATQEPLLKILGQKLANASDPAKRATVVYLKQGSCANIAGMYAEPTKAVTQTMQYIPSAELDPSFTPDKAAPTCSVGAGVTPDIANSNAFVSACVDETTQPANVAQFRAAIQAYGFIVPKQSSQTALTAEEGYFVFGFGAQGQAKPWLDESSAFILTPERSTLITTMAAVGVTPRDKARGVPLAPNDVVNKVAQSTSPEATIGLAGVELYDRARDSLKILAFQAFGQRAAYFPDMKATSFDKNNVRNGLYFVWSPTIYLTKVDPQTKAIVSSSPERAARIQEVIDVLQGKATVPGVEPIDAMLAVGLVPNCAMKVTRDYEGGPLSRYKADQTCHCYYESKYPDTYTSKCATCTEDAQCGGGKCSHGFCEAP